MEIFNSGTIRITQKYGLMTTSINARTSEEIQHLMLGDLGITVYIKGVPYTALTDSDLVRANRNTSDGKYHFIYIQVNVATGEYYVGKVNRKKWTQVKKYQGSGLRFISKYKKHKEDFIRYHIQICTSNEESEKVEATIVDEELLNDPLCLNLVQGGGGTSHHSTQEKREKHRKYMIEHHEQYQPMRTKAKELYQSGVSSLALLKRNRAIKDTMNSDYYKNMSSERIKNWKNNNPQAYAKARRNNKIAVQTPTVQQRRIATRRKHNAEDPEAYEQSKKKVIAAQHSPEAEAKRSISLKAYNKEHPELSKKRCEASAKATRKAVNMLDIKTRKVLKHFESQQKAAEWLVSQGIAKNTNCKSSISSVCLKKEIPGHGTKQTAYGYAWEFA